MPMRCPSCALALLVFVACSGNAKRSDPDGAGGGPVEAGIQPSEPVCDGSARLRLRFFFATFLGRNYNASTVEVEQGAPSFAVDGECSYWIDAGWMTVPDGVDFRHLGWRTGKVAPELEAELNELPLGQLNTVADCVPTAIFDSPPRVISDDMSGGGCVESGPRLDAAWDIVASRAPELWARGTPATGRGVWVSAVEARSDTSRAYAWPLTEPLASFVLPPELWSSVGVSRLVTEAEGASELRALLARYAEDKKATPGYFQGGNIMSDGVTYAVLYQRDALPYEDERGLWPFSGPP